MKNIRKSILEKDPFMMYSVKRWAEEGEDAEKLFEIDGRKIRKAKQTSK